MVFLAVSYVVLAGKHNIFFFLQKKTYLLKWSEYHIKQTGKLNNCFIKNTQRNTSKKHLPNSVLGQSYTTACKAIKIQ